jgi:hypothetical protein
MQAKKKQNLTTKENILLASIPVIGSIVIALITTNNFKCNTSTSTPDPNLSEEKKLQILKSKAGTVNENVAYNRYQDLLPMLAEGVKPYITENIFRIESDSIKTDLGEFIKPIDTIYSKAYGNDNFFVRNQYQRGINIVTVAFDQNEKVIALITKHVPNQ